MPSWRLFSPRSFLQELRSYMQEDLERTKKFGSAKVCLGSSFAEHNIKKMNLFHLRYFFLLKRRKEKNQNLPTRTINPFVYINRKEWQTVKCDPLKTCIYVVLEIHASLFRGWLTFDCSLSSLENECSHIFSFSAIEPRGFKKWPFLS
jgi:hypothetical protein